jgi:hypothetical protein
MCDDCDLLWNSDDGEWRETGTYLGGWDHYSHNMEYVFHYDLFRCETCKTVWMRDHQNPLRYLGGNIVWKEFSPVHERYLITRLTFCGRS